MGACTKKPGGKTVALACASAVVGLALLGVVGFTSHNAYTSMLNNSSTAMSFLSDMLAGRYSSALDEYQLVASKHTANAVVGVVVPQGSTGDTSFPASLEAAGLDPQRVIMDGDGTYVYLIAPGDTLTSISAAFGYSVNEIANDNEIRDVNLIYANSALRIPTE